MTGLASSPLAPPGGDGPGGLGWLVLALQAVPVLAAALYWVALEWRLWTGRKDGRER